MSSLLHQLIYFLLLSIVMYSNVKAPGHLSLLFQIVMSKARKYIIKILAKYIRIDIFFNKTIFTIGRTNKIYRKLSFCFRKELNHINFYIHIMNLTVIIAVNITRSVFG